MTTRSMVHNLHVKIRIEDIHYHSERLDFDLYFKSLAVRTRA